MKILHIENHAGVAHELAEAQKRAGHEATVMETWWNPTDQPHDVDFYYGREGLIDDLRKMRRVVRFSEDYDIVHLHGGINRKRLDVLGIKIMKRKPLVVHYHGSETREGFGMSYQWIPSARIVSRPDLLKWHPDAVFLPNPVAERDNALNMAAKPRIVHLTNNRVTKGTNLIVRAMDILKENMDVDFCLVEKRPHQDALAEIERSHILIDQVIDTKTIGVPSVIGVAALEAMSMGLAAVSTFDEEFRPYYPGCPVVAVGPSVDSLLKHLRPLLSDMKKVKALGIEGQRYVRYNHSPDRLAQRTLDIYSKVLGRPA
jgi:glycosyltransferase involved in cell wall biosynthesis